MPGCSLWGRRRGRLYDRRGRQPAATVRGPRNDADGCLNDTCQAGSQSDHKNKCLVNLLSRPYSRSEPGDVRGTSSPREGQVFDFLPPFLKRLYRSLRVPYARGTRVRETPEPEPEIAVSMRERMFRVEIIQDAFCERLPKPQRLFRSPPGHRNMESWCDLEVSRYPTTRRRCAHCTETRALFKRANDGDWQAEVRLHRLATHASIRLLAARRAWAETSRRQRAARTPEPGPPPGIWAMLGWKRWRERRAEYPPATDRWFIVERRAAEAKLVRDHTRTLQRMAQRSRARARDRELAREAAHHLHAAEQPPDRVPGPDEKVTQGTIPSSSRGAQRRGDPGQRDKRPSRGPGLPRRQAAARNDEAHAAAPLDPPSEAAPPEATPRN